MDAPLCTAKPASTGKYSNIKVKLGERKLETMDIMAIVKEGTTWEDYLEERIDKEELASPTSRSQDQNLFLPTNNY